MVTHEGAPSLGRRSTAPEHLLGDARLSDLEAELEQLAMDARRPHNGTGRAGVSTSRTVAQRLEPSAHNGLVGGSNPSSPTTRALAAPKPPEATREAACKTTPPAKRTRKPSPRKPKGG